MSLCFAAEKQFSVAEVIQDNFLWSKSHFSSYSISLSKKELDHRLIRRNRCLTVPLVQTFILPLCCFFILLGEQHLSWRNNWNRFSHVFHYVAHSFHVYGLRLAKHIRCHGLSLNYYRYIVICMNFSITLQRIFMLYNMILIPILLPKLKAGGSFIFDPNLFSMNSCCRLLIYIFACLALVRSSYINIQSTL